MNRDDSRSKTRRPGRAGSWSGMRRAGWEAPKARTARRSPFSQETTISAHSSFRRRIDRRERIRGTDVAKTRFDQKLNMRGEINATTLRRHSDVAGARFGHRPERLRQGGDAGAG